jgi:hypothetical protein
MTNTLRAMLSIALVLYFILVILLLMKRRLALKYTLLWLLLGVCLAVLVAFPRLLGWLCLALGFESPMNALFVCAIGFAFILLMALTSIVSRQSSQIKNLTQENALLEKLVREMEKKDE